jgi:RNA polymerase sigma-70 factor (ECF subfamily)
MRSDPVLAERAAAGDEAAFDVLYERHRPVVLAVCMGVLGTAHDAEDATQEVFTALSIALRTKVPPELRPWLIRVARNASIDTTRRRKHRLLTFDGELPEIPVRPSSAKAELEGWDP